MNQVLGALVSSLFFFGAPLSFWYFCLREKTKARCPYCKEIVILKNTEIKDYSKYFHDDNFDTGESIDAAEALCPKCHEWFRI
jgi:uncharacterized protein YbaR (Trm112 family)